MMKDSRGKTGSFAGIGARSNWEAERGVARGEDIRTAKKREMEKLNRPFGKPKRGR